jgi:hypothetical protein
MATPAPPQAAPKEVKTDHVRKAVLAVALGVTVLCGSILVFGFMRGGDRQDDADVGRRPAPATQPAAGSYQQRLEQYRARSPQEEQQQAAAPKAEAPQGRSQQELEWVRQQLLKNMAVNEAPPDRRGATRVPPAAPPAAVPAPQSALAPSAPPQPGYDALAERINQLRAQRAAQTGGQP